MFTVGLANTRIWTGYYAQNFPDQCSKLERGELLTKWYEVHEYMFIIIHFKEET